MHINMDLSIARRSNVRFVEQFDAPDFLEGRARRDLLVEVWEGRGGCVRRGGLRERRVLSGDDRRRFREA